MKEFFLITSKSKFTSYIETALTVAFTIIQPILGVLVCVLLFIISNMISGIYTQKKTKERNENLKLSKLIDKTFRYIFFIGIIYFADYYILSDMVKLFFDKIPFIITKIVALIIISIELESMNDNYKLITGKSFMDKIRALLKAGKSISKEISDDTKQIKENVT